MKGYARRMSAESPSLKVTGRLVAVGDDSNTGDVSLIIERESQEARDVHDDEGDEHFVEVDAYRLPCDEANARAFAPFLYHDIEITVRPLAEAPAQHPPSEE